MGYTNDVGFKDGKILPFMPFGDDFVVFPLVIMDSCFMDVNNYHKKLIELIEISKNNDAILVVNWHQRSFNENEFPGYRKAYCEIIEECYDKVSSLLRDVMTADSAKEVQNLKKEIEELKTWEHIR